MGRTVSVDEKADAIGELLEEYSDLATDGMKSAVQKSAKFVKEEISANAPKRTGAYAKSWTSTKTQENSTFVQYTVHSKNRYQLAHLLENGHALRNGGRAKAYPHIAPAEVVGEGYLENLIEEALKECPMRKLWQ